MEDVIYYLYYEWFHQSYGKDQEVHGTTDYYVTSKFSNNEDMEIPKFVKEFTFIPKYDNVFILIESALYLDLPKLIDICADYIAKIFDGIFTYKQFL